MAKRNVNDQHQLLPEKIERRLGQLLEMGEFDQDDIAHCRRDYWGARDAWHQILVDCYEMAQQRQQATAAPAPAPRPAPRVIPDRRATNMADRRAAA